MRSAIAETAALALLPWQLIVATVPVAVLTYVIEGPLQVDWSPGLVGIILYQGVLASGVAPDGHMADYIVAMMLQGQGRDAVGNHPPERYRFEDARARLGRAGVRSLADGVDLADVERAARRAGVTRRPR